VSDVVFFFSNKAEDLQSAYRRSKLNKDDKGQTDTILQNERTQIKSLVATLQNVQVKEAHEQGNTKALSPSHEASASRQSSTTFSLAAVESDDTALALLTDTDLCDLDSPNEDVVNTLVKLWTVPPVRNNLTEDDDDDEYEIPKAEGRPIYDNVAELQQKLEQEWIARKELEFELELRMEKEREQRESVSFELQKELSRIHQLEAQLEEEKRKVTPERPKSYDSSPRSSSPILWTTRDSVEKSPKLVEFVYFTDYEGREFAFPLDKCQSWMASSIFSTGKEQG
jgi:hypothetical protein